MKSKEIYKNGKNISGDDQQAITSEDFSVANSSLNMEAPDNGFYDSFFKKNRVAMLIIDPENGNILDANDSACSFYGYSLDNFRKIKIFDINKANYQDILDSLKLVMKEPGKESTHEHILADGTLRTVKVCSGVVFFQGKTCLYFSMFDISEYICTQLELAESEDKFKKLYINAPVPYQSLDINGNFIEVNEAFCKALGYKKEELIGQNFSKVLHPVWRKHFVENFKNFKEIGEILGVEFKMLRKDGDYALVSFTGKIGRNHDGSFKQTHCVFRDITSERKRILGLLENEHRFRNLFEDLEMVAVQGYDEDRNVLFWNKSSEELYGYTAEEALGKKIEDLIIPENMREQVVKEITDWIVGGTSIPAGELELSDKYGNLVPVYSSHVMQHNHSGNKEIYCIDVDLTEIKKANIKLLRAKEEAERANRAKSLFLANMSHELRTPLNGIMGMHGLLQATGLSPEQNKYVDGAVASAKRLTSLLGDVLDLSKIEAGKISLIDEQFNLVEMLEQIRDLFAPACLQKELELRFSIDKHLHEIVCGDQIRLVQILTNLLGNSIKFTDSGFVGLEAYFLGYHSDGRMNVLFVVSDSGIGISDSELDNIFEVFMQGEDSYVRRYQGAGLGLSIVKQLTKMMGGTLSIESVKGEGTKIFFSLFMKLGSDDSNLGLNNVDNTLPEAKECSRILLVEDEAINRLVLKKMLEKHGVEVTCASNGREAISQLKENDFDVVLMDIQMPVMDGIEATKRIRSGQAGERGKEIPIIALTAYAMTGDREMFIASGMNDYFTKPVDIENLMKILK